MKLKRFEEKFTTPSTEIHQLLPLAITKSDEEYGCVGGLSLTGEWIRPIPIKVKSLIESNSPFQYRQRTNIVVNNEKIYDTIRPEDRKLISIDNNKHPITHNQMIEIIGNHLDNDVDEAFSHNRSLGLIQATVHDIYLKPSTQKRIFIRMKFSDNKNNEYDWIVPEINLGKQIWGLDALETQIKFLRSHTTCLCLGLTLPNNRFPGLFRGCHPLVVGVHTKKEW